MVSFHVSHVRLQDCPATFTKHVWMCNFCITPWDLDTLPQANILSSSLKGLSQDSERSRIIVPVGTNYSWYPTLILEHSLEWCYQVYTNNHGHHKRPHFCCLTSRKFFNCPGGWMFTIEVWHGGVRWAPSSGPMYTFSVSSYKIVGGEWVCSGHLCLEGPLIPLWRSQSWGPHFIEGFGNVWTT